MIPKAYRRHGGPEGSLPLCRHPLFDGRSAPSPRHATPRTLARCAAPLSAFSGLSAGSPLAARARRASRAFSERFQTLEPRRHRGAPCISPRRRRRRPRTRIPGRGTAVLCTADGLYRDHAHGTDGLYRACRGHLIGRIGGGGSTKAAVRDVTSDKARRRGGASG